MRNTFVKTLLEIAKQDKNVYIVTGDLGFGVLKPFWDELPDQIINAGIETVIVRDTKDEYRVIDVSEWIENDDSLSGTFGY